MWPTPISWPASCAANSATTSGPPATFSRRWPSPRLSATHAGKPVHTSTSGGLPTPGDRTTRRAAISANPRPCSSRPATTTGHPAPALCSPTPRTASRDGGGTLGVSPGLAWVTVSDVMAYQVSADHFFPFSRPGPGAGAGREHGQRSENQQAGRDDDAPPPAGGQ